MAKFLRLHRLGDKVAVTLNPASIQHIERVAAVEARPAIPARPATAGAKAWPPATKAVAAVPEQAGSPESAIIHIMDSTVTPLHVFETQEAIETAINGDAEIVDDRPEAKALRESEERAKADAAEKARAEADAADDRDRPAAEAGAETDART